jgi:glutamate N-acetyltransferase/amino-acid N-acetyltransferase
MRYQGRPDLGLILAESFYSGAAVFTDNVCQAAPVIWSKDRFREGRAILANAGQANAQTGNPGLRDAAESASRLGELLGLDPNGVLLASTGIIGAPLNMEHLIKALPGLVRDLREDGFDGFSRAILTTDTVPKVAEAEVDSGGLRFSIWGCCKGSGMIAPSMATMLAFVLTDLKVEEGLLLQLLRDGTDKSFNRITVDGDTSTNDSLFLMSSGLSGDHPVSDPESREALAFREALQKVLTELALSIARDGEGATRLVSITVKGARDASEASRAARTVAESPLVKTAFYGQDPNWGRVLAALGRSGALFDPYKVDIDLDSVPWVRKGVDNGKEPEAKAVMGQRTYSMTIDLHNGKAEDTVHTTDLSHEYVSINASYRS